MIKNTHGESLVGIIIGVFILAFIILGVTNLLINSRATLEVYENKKIISILKNNTETVIKKIDTDMIKETELFYLRKNNNFMNYEVLTGTTNSIYKYIDKEGNTVDDLINFEGDIYSRQLWLERNDNSNGNNHQIIKISIKKLTKK